MLAGRITPAAVARPDNMSTLVLLKGQPGCGKSTLGAALARRLQFAFVSKDSARDALQPVVHLSADVDWNTLAYSIMWSFAGAQLQAGQCGVVVDSPLARVQLFEAAQEVAQTVRGR
jgi:predicted kinase